MARVTFSSARQEKVESVDDWANRVCTLDGNAYRDLMHGCERERGWRASNKSEASVHRTGD
ncbi:hypothetical protein DPMN_089231 [Dreissena polymorpha]|uniref:Uncharacterized protein n=1 Tax=Dreissena polymorpha TaxID=45954 RepID=A0A9D4KWE0_DREPO|nr:hypothetical protein DPMN_089231 [Dreissena polymorpha]